MSESHSVRSDSLQGNDMHKAAGDSSGSFGAGSLSGLQRSLIKKLHDKRLRGTIRDYLVYTFVGHALGVIVFTPYNFVFLKYSWEQFILTNIGGIPIAIAWNYSGYRLTVYVSDRLKKKLHWEESA